MSEYINNKEGYTNDLLNYAKGILDGRRGSEMYEEYREAVKSVTPVDVVTIVDELVKTGEDISDIKRAVNKILNIFYEPIKTFGKVEVEKNSFLYYLMEENQEMEKRMKDLKTEIKAVFQQKDKTGELQKRKDIIKSKLLDLQEYDKHNQKKENILFPYFEKLYPDHLCVSVMWSMHDDARSCFKKLITNLEREKPSINEFNQEIGKLYFAILPVIFREEYILYPICQKVIDQQIWDEMLLQSKEIGFAFINGPKNSLKSEKVEKVHDGLIDLGSGKLSIDRINLLFNHLPVDITYVDENDEVRYFSNPKSRHFTRSKAIIGRKVQNCHPPESIDVVNKIIETFKTGTKDTESFWIQMKGEFILIQYFAVRDTDGIYKGIVEVSQDITEIRELEGEKRLMA
ncbi:MAG: PAS domain-containing protein [Bacteroidales bacterium]|nr:PAS domain-containing protein [Bacteroidales bacterium]MCF8402839.1 PAS domain-containing protein [Bacteroidales bacterium]